MKIISQTPKPVDRYDYLLALLCSVELCSEESKNIEQINSIVDKFLSSDNCFLFSPDFQSKLTEDQIESIIDLCFVLLSEKSLSCISSHEEKLTLLLCSKAI